MDYWHRGHCPGRRNPSYPSLWPRVTDPPERQRDPVIGGTALALRVNQSRGSPSNDPGGTCVWPHHTAWRDVSNRGFEAVREAFADKFARRSAAPVVAFTMDK